MTMPCRGARDGSPARGGRASMTVPARRFTRQPDSTPARGRTPAREAAYRAAAYIVLLPGARRLTLRVGRCEPALDRLLARHALRDWAFLTAWNPQGAVLAPGRNAQRQRGLRRSLRGVRLLLPGAGWADDATWCEASLLAVPLSSSRAMRLGRQFGQLAVLVGTRGGSARLAWCERRRVG